MKLLLYYPAVGSDCPSTFPQETMRARCTCARLSRRCPLYLSETIGIMCRGTRATTASPSSPRRLVRTSYNRCSYVPLTRRATITLMHCPVFRRLTTRRHRRFALSQIELNRITGSRVKIIVTRIALSQLSYDSSSCALSRIKRLDRATAAFPSRQLACRGKTEIHYSISHERARKVARSLIRDDVSREARVIGRRKIVVNVCEVKSHSPVSLSPGTPRLSLLSLMKASAVDVKV